MMEYFGLHKSTPEERLREIELRHVERMKALEMGRPLPEVEIAQAKAEEVRIRATAGWAIVRVIFAVIGPAVICGIAIGATAVILHEASPSMHLPLICTVWVSAAVVCLGMIAGSLLGGQRMSLSDLLRGPTSRKLTVSGGSMDADEFGPVEADRLLRSIQK
jgi:hypothetical protein